MGRKGNQINRPLTPIEPSTISNPEALLCSSTSSPEMTLVSPRPVSEPVTPVTAAPVVSKPSDATLDVTACPLSLSTNNILNRIVEKPHFLDENICDDKCINTSPPASHSTYQSDKTSESEANAQPDRIGVPDGGLRAWLVVLGGFLNFTIGFGLLNSFGTFQARYAYKWPMSVSNVAWIGSVQLFILFLGGIIVGPAFDRFGARRLLFIGTFFCFLSFISTSFATKYSHYLCTQGFLFGIGNALLFYPSTGAISEWFDNKRGLALGLAVSGASFGGVFWPILVDKLFQVVEEAWVHRIVCVISIPLLLVSCSLIKERKGVAGHDTSGNQSKPTQRSFSKAIFEWRFLALCLSLLFVYCGMLVPFYFIPLYAEEDVHLGTSMANNLLAIGYGGSMLGRIGAGWLADRLGRFNVLFLIGTLTSIVTFCWMKMDTFPTMVAFVVFFGLFSGGLVPLGSACVAQTTPDMGHIGLRIGAMMAFCSAGALAGGPIGGAIKDITGSWPPVFAFSGAMTLFGSALLLVVRFTWQSRWNFKV